MNFDIDFYKELKNGTSEEEIAEYFDILLNEFNEAKAKVAKEREKAMKDADAYLLKGCRENLAAQIIQYIKAVFGDAFDEKTVTFDLVIDALKDFEKDMSAYIQFSNNLKPILEKTVIKKNEKADSIYDNEIIRDFLASLK